MYSCKDEELDYECVGSDERQMGDENAYSGTIELDCEACENHMMAEFNFWEYPSQALNYSDTSSEGCSIIEEPDYQDFLFDKPEPDFDSEI